MNIMPERLSICRQVPRNQRQADERLTVRLEYALTKLTAHTCEMKLDGQRCVFHARYEANLAQNMISRTEAAKTDGQNILKNGLRNTINHVRPDCFTLSISCS